MQSDAPPDRPDDEPLRDGPAIDENGISSTQRRASGGAALLASAMLGLAEVLDPKPPRDLGAEVVDAPTDQPDLDLTFGPLDPLD